MVRRRPLEDRDGVARLELLGEELAGEHPAGEVVGRHEGRRPFPTGNVVVNEDDDDSGVDCLLQASWTFGLVGVTTIAWTSCVTIDSRR